MPELLEVTTKLMRIQQKANVKEFRLPQIAVVGSQSSGKSSVLEAIVRRDFLPRGSGIVTRVPLQLTLLHDESIPADGEYGVFSHKPDQRFGDFAEIQQEIINQTNVLAGSGLSVINKPIYLTIHSPNVVNLILIDLPGLTQNRTGDQPPDIVKRIEELVSSYIKDPNTIILAVSPGDNDLANSRAIRFAKEYDPDMNRTLGVITKVDLATDEQEMRKNLRNQTVAMKLGYVGVRLRSPQDIKEGKPLEQALYDEEQFFQSNPAYMDFADQCGTRYLESKLSNMLLKAVQQFLPTLQVKLQRLQEDYSKKLDDCGPPPSDQGSPQVILLQVIHDFTRQYQMNLNGNISDIPGAQDKEKDQYFGGSQLNHSLFDYYPEQLAKRNIDWESQETYQRLMQTIQDAGGVQQSVFPGDKVMIQYCKESIKLLEEPSFSVIDKVHHECKSIMSAAITAVSGISRFGSLKERVLKESHALLDNLRQSTIDNVKSYFSAQKSYININHPELQTEQLWEEAKDAAARNVCLCIRFLLL